MLRLDEGSLDHVVPRSRGGKDAWENLVWSAKEVNQKADRLPHEAGLKLLSIPRAPKELPVSVLIRNSAEVEDWKLNCSSPEDSSRWRDDHATGLQQQPSNPEAVWHTSNVMKIHPFYEHTSKRRKGFPSETRVGKGNRIVHGDKELVEKLGRRDPCPCGSGRRFQKLLPEFGDL